MARPVQEIAFSGLTSISLDSTDIPPPFQSNLLSAASGPCSTAVVMAGCQAGQRSMSLMSFHTLGSGASIKMLASALIGADS